MFSIDRPLRKSIQTAQINFDNLLRTKDLPHSTWQEISQNRIGKFSIFLLFLALFFFFW